MSIHNKNCYKCGELLSHFRESEDEPPEYEICGDCGEAFCFRHTVFSSTNGPLCRDCYEQNSLQSKKKV